MAASPWAYSVKDIKRLERSGPVYYKIDKSSSLLYDRLDNIYAAIKSGEPARALSEIGNGRADDPRNAIFDYLQAVVYSESGDNRTALKYIAAGNARRKMLLYANGNIAPERWQWPQFDLIRYVGKRIVRDPASDREDLLVVLQMGQQMMWSNPPDLVRLLQALEVRQSAARRLKLIGEKEGDRALVEMCLEIAEEGQRFRRAAGRMLAQSEELNEDTRAWVIGRAIRGGDERFRRAAMLLYMEKQAERADNLRRQMLRKNVLEESAD